MGRQRGGKGEGGRGVDAQAQQPGWLTGASQLWNRIVVWRLRSHDVEPELISPEERLTWMVLCQRDGWRGAPIERTREGAYYQLNLRPSDSRRRVRQWPATKRKSGSGGRRGRSGGSMDLLYGKNKPAGPIIYYYMKKKKSNVKNAK